jgi:type VI protein secretion system component Hcp
MAIDVYLHIEGTEGMLLIDHVSLQFSKVKWKNPQQRIGGVVGQTADGWGLFCNKSCAYPE